MIYTRALFEEDPKLKKKYPELTEPQSDLEDENDIEDFEDNYFEEKTKEFEAAWQRAKKNMEDSQAPEEEFNAKKEKHEEKLKKLKEEYDNWIENRGNNGWTLPKGSKSADALLKLIQKTDEMISKNKLKREDKEALKSIALSTSKTNYLDPRYAIVAILRVYFLTGRGRITTAFSKRWNIPLEKLFNRSLRKKCTCPTLCALLADLS
jgi:DNA topoisomerase-1